MGLKTNMVVTVQCHVLGARDNDVGMIGLIVCLTGLTMSECAKQWGVVYSVSHDPSIASVGFLCRV